MHLRRGLPERWRSLGEATGLLDPEAAAEFPPGADEPPAPLGLGRRELMRLFGASMMLAGIGGCARAPRGKVVPYGTPPPEVTPGVADAYATAMTLDGYATGLLVESHEGRPTKVEGNPDHPASLGATGVLEQASILSLYDPARAQWILRRGSPESWRRLGESLLAARGGGGGWEGLHLLLEPTSSPWIGALLDELAGRGATVHYDAPASRAAVWAGTRAVFGEALDPVLDLRRANVIVSLDADLLARGPFHCRHARDFADGRRVRGPADAMNRLYAAGPMLTVTSSCADHRLRVKARDVAIVAASLLREVGAVTAVPWLSRLGGSLGRLPESQHAEAWARTVAKDLLSNRGRSIVAAGDAQPPVVHALVAAMNHALGNGAETVRYVRPAVRHAGTPAHGLAPLAAELDAGRVRALVILGGNPIHTAPADMELGRRIEGAGLTAYLGAYDNETARRCEWLVPQAHYLETWGDARALDGTASIVQPLIAPLFGGRSIPEVLGLMLGRAVGYDGLVAHWASRGVDLTRAWPRALQRGVVDGTASPAEAVEPEPDGLAALIDATPHAPPGLELVLPLDGKVHDGSFGNNAWLQELPDAMTKLTWGNAALVSPATAARLGVATEDVVLISSAGRSVRAPVMVMPGQADDSLALALGYGRQGAEELASAGVDAYPLRTAGALYVVEGVSIAKTDDRRALATTQEHWSMERRPLARREGLAHYRLASGATSAERPRRTLYQLKPDAPNQWAMSIDLNACTGCSVCVVACQAENNVPVVGEAGVRKSREMHWLRVDRYFSGSLDEPEVDVEPMACQHCEKAPCEYVCPVGATVHSPDGLNEMVYNRCVGTRFCSNNCPYKVRRFNWFDYNRDKSEPARMLMNPDVTVRARGVMEKCSYCVQRIREAEIRARRSGRPLADGDVETACQKACPSSAIVFGSLADPASVVSRLHADARSYKILDELGTEPRTRYMVRLRNPNPELSG